MGLATWAIGDLQGCRAPLDRLLEKISFDISSDHLWLLGDLVGRGPDSLGVLDLIISLGERAITVLGNHDLHFLASAVGIKPAKEKDQLNQILDHPDREKYINFITNQSLIHYSPEQNTVMAHAGIYPWWSLDLALSLSSEVSAVLQGAQKIDFLRHMYGDTPTRWDPSLAGWPRLRFITNALTRMRFCDQHGHLDFDQKGSAVSTPTHLRPWFDFPNAQLNKARVIFGHWSTMGLVNRHPYLGLDTGCVWGECLSAVHLEAEHVNIVSVPCDRA